jgi:hypothetical protein
MLEYLQSKDNGAATLQELKYLCRRANMPGMAETIIGWLEQAGVVRFEREIEAIYLIPPGKRQVSRAAAETAETEAMTETPTAEAEVDE